MRELTTRKTLNKEGLYNYYLVLRISWLTLPPVATKTSPRLKVLTSKVSTLVCRYCQMGLFTSPLPIQFINSPLKDNFSMYQSIITILPLGAKISTKLSMTCSHFGKPESPKSHTP